MIAMIAKLTSDQFWFNHSKKQDMYNRPIPKCPVQLVRTRNCCI